MQCAQMYASHNRKPSQRSLSQQPSSLFSAAKMHTVPSDKNSSTPIESLSGPRAFGYELLACKALTNRCAEGSFAFAGARMPLELVPHKD